MKTWSRRSIRLRRGTSLAITQACSTPGVNCCPEIERLVVLRCVIGGTKHATGATCRRVLRCAVSAKNVGVPISSSPSNETLGTRRFPTTTWSTQCGGGGLDFDAYLKKRKFCWNHPIYTDWDGRTLLVDRILRYEFLDIELGEICRHLGLPYPGKLLPRSKGGLRKDRRHYREVYTPEQAGVVKQAFEREISLHGYEY